MPLGVDHDKSPDAFYYEVLSVRKPLMPLGVDHEDLNVYLVAFGKRAKTFDAIRR